jgi:hypothetical protein
VSNVNSWNNVKESYDMAKEIVFSLNPIVNLVLHVLCCADPTFPRKPIYDIKAEEWLLPDERMFFEENFKLEQTGKVSTTAYFAVLLQVPVYFASDSIDSLTGTLQTMAEEGLEGLKKKFPDKGVLIDYYMPERFQRKTFGEPGLFVNAETIARYAEILDEVYGRYYRSHWPTMVPEMEGAAKSLVEEYIEGYDVIGLWEEETHLEFPYPRFVVELADPIKTLGTSLMAERDTFSSWVSKEKTFGMISHEVGTHIITQTQTLEEGSLGGAFEQDAEKILRIGEALAYLVNLKIWRDTEKSLGYSEGFKAAFGEEIQNLKGRWGEWERGALSTTDLIIKTHERMTD